MPDAEIKIVLRVHEDALMTAPTNDELRKLVGAENAPVFIVERVTIPTERTRTPAIAQSTRLEDQIAAWVDATEQALTPARVERVLQKVDEVQR
jgi:hypothetical protein